MARGLIAPGEVDERDIREVQADDLRGYTQCHFFAGIGVWSYALRLAGWPDDRPVWTGSCPCQPFSAAGAGEGFEDPRHLWPAWYRLIAECRPERVFGEQVAAKYGLAWLDHVHVDLENAAYTVGAVDTCAAGVGAPHIRQRLYFVADHYGERLSLGKESRHTAIESEQPAPRRADAGGRGGLGRVVHADGARLPLGESQPASPREGGAGALEAGATRGFWADAEWIYCRDGRYRPVEPGTFPLAHGAHARVGRLRAYGNAINAEQAAEFIRAYLDERGP